MSVISCGFSRIVRRLNLSSSSLIFSSSLAVPFLLELAVSIGFCLGILNLLVVTCDFPNSTNLVLHPVYPAPPVKKPPAGIILVIYAKRKNLIVKSLKRRHPGLASERGRDKWKSNTPCRCILWLNYSVICSIKKRHYWQKPFGTIIK